VRFANGAPREVRHGAFNFSTSAAQNRDSTVDRPITAARKTKPGGEPGLLPIRMESQHSDMKISKPTMPQKRSGTPSRKHDPWLGVTPLDDIAPELRKLEALGARNRGWAEEATALAKIVVDGGLGVIGRSVRQNHRQYHRSHGRQLCTGNCVGWDLTAVLAFGLYNRGIKNSAPKWLIIKSAVEGFTGATLPELAYLKRVILLDLAQLKTVVRKGQQSRTARERRLVGKYAAFAHMLRGQRTTESDHPSHIAKPH
jgi:hypothetical protein